jgi:hypothetical protein
VGALETVQIIGGLALIVAGTVSIIRGALLLGVGLVFLGILVGPGGLTLFGD